MWTFVRYYAKGEFSVLIFIVSVQETENYQEKITFSEIIPEISSKIDIQRTLSCRPEKFQVCLRHLVILYHHTCVKLSFPLPRLYSDQTKGYFCTKNACISLYFDCLSWRRRPSLFLKEEMPVDNFTLCVCERERDRDKQREKRKREKMSNLTVSRLNVTQNLPRNVCHIQGVIIRVIFSNKCHITISLIHNDYNAISILMLQVTVCRPTVR